MTLEQIDQFEKDCLRRDGHELGLAINAFLKVCRKQVEDEEWLRKELAAAKSMLTFDQHVELIKHRKPLRLDNTEWMENLAKDLASFTD